MNQPVKKFIEINGQNICYLVRAGRESETIFCIHGLGGCKDAFCDIWEADGFDNYTIISIDLPGFGESSKDPEYSFSMQDQARLCLEMINKLKIEKCHLVLHSMAGPIGLLFAEELESKLISMAYIEGNLIPSDCGLLSRKTSSVSFEEFENKLLPKFKSFITNSPAEIAGIQQSGPLGFYRSSASLVEVTDSGKTMGLLRDIKCKKAYFYGEKNSEMEVLEKLNFLQKICIPNSGHSVMNDNPKDFYAALLEFIGNAVSKSSGTHLK